MKTAETQLQPGCRVRSQQSSARKKKQLMQLNGGEAWHTELTQRFVPEGSPSVLCSWHYVPSSGDKALWFTAGNILSKYTFSDLFFLNNICFTTSRKLWGCCSKYGAMQMTDSTHSERHKCEELSCSCATVDGSSRKYIELYKKKPRPTFQSFLNTLRSK